MQDALLYLFGVLIIFVGLALSIALHEVGHLLPAKLFRVKVTQFMVGFGKTLWSRKKGETEYGFKLIPLGGYVSMIGMYPPKHPGEVSRESTTGFFQEVVGEARKASAETITVGDDDRAFYRLAEWKKVIIMLGGPLMNLVLAIVFYAILVAGFGVPQATTTVGQVNECLVSANAQATECTSDMPEAPAAAAGLLPGDTVVAIDGEAMTEWDRVREIVAANPEQPLNFEIEREGKTQTLQLTPAVNERARADASGAKIVGPDGEVEVESVGMMGVVPTMELERQPVTAAPALVFDNIRAVGDVIIHMPQRLVDVWQAAFGSEERALNGPVSVVGVGRIAGDLVSNDATPVVDKAQAMVGLLASLNVALFVFNLIPLTPLDGGHIAGAVYEGAKRRLWKLFGKGDPGPVDTAKMVPVTLVVATLLLGMTLLLIYADIVKPMSLS